MIAHMIVLELVCSQHFRQKLLGVQEFSAGHQHRLPCNILIIEGTHHSGFHQAAHDGEQILEVQVHLVGLGFGKHNHHGQLAIGMHARRIHWKVLFEIAVYPQSAMIQGNDNVGIILKQRRFAEQRFSLRACGHQTRETTTIIDSVNTETIAAQRILHNANGRTIQLLRLHFVQFTGHRIHFAETVTSADNLPAQHTTIIEHIVVQVTQERKSFTQQTVFVTHESQVFAIAHLYIPTYCARNEIHHKRNPVRRIVKQWRE